MAERFIMRIELTGPAKERLTKLSDKHGMTQVAMMSRLVEFFAAQDEGLRTLMMSRLSDDLNRKFARTLLTHMNG